MDLRGMTTRRIPTHIASPATQWVMSHTWIRGVKKILWGKIKNQQSTLPWIQGKWLRGGSPPISRHLCTYKSCHALEWEGKTNNMRGEKNAAMDSRGMTTRRIPGVMSHLWMCDINSPQRWKKLFTAVHVVDATPGIYMEKWRIYMYLDVFTCMYMVYTWINDVYTCKDKWRIYMYLHVFTCTPKNTRGAKKKSTRKHGEMTYIHVFTCIYRHVHLYTCMYTLIRSVCLHIHASRQLAGGHVRIIDRRV